MTGVELRCINCGSELLLNSSKMVNTRDLRCLVCEELGTLRTAEERDGEIATWFELAKRHSEYIAGEVKRLDGELGTLNERLGVLEKLLQEKGLLGSTS